MPDPTTFGLTGLLVIAGATISSMAGFGFAIATMPFLLMLYAPKQAVAMSVAISMSGSIIQWFRVRQHADYRLVLKLAAGSLVGVPLGGYVIGVINPNLLKALIGVAVTIAATLSLTRRSSPDLPARLPNTGATVAAGVGAGMLATTVGQSGIIVASLMAWTRLDKLVVRASLVSYFIITNAASVSTFYAQSILTPRLAATVAMLLPFYVLGLYIGDWGFRNTGQTGYRRVLLGVLSLSAVIGLYNGLSALFG